MPYVRQHGRQLVLVHGARSATTCRVEQRELFTLYSKPEALEAIGQGSRLFRDLIVAQYPDLRFGWAKIDRAIREKLHVLPDTYEYAADRVRGSFRKCLCAFAAQLAHADPVSLASAAETLREHRHELAWLADLINGRLQCADSKPTSSSADNEYCWKFALRGSDVPSEEFEYLAGLFKKRKYDELAALCRLFLEAFGEDPDLHNYLGLIAIENGKVAEAIAEFRETIRLGRRSCPKRISKKSFQSDFRARPYLRGLTNLASALNLSGKFKEALAVLDHLDAECGDTFTANSWRAIIYLNTGRWEEAAKAANGFQVVPSESLPASLALHELGRHEDAAVHALHAAMNSPRASRILHGLPVEKPRTAWEADDWNEGVHLQRHLQTYLECRTRQSRDFFRNVLQHPRLLAFQHELARAEAAWEKREREGFVRMNHLKSIEFARTEGTQLLPRHPRTTRRS